MFDKLVESTSTGAELKPRRRIFAATFLLVSIFFATAVVASIYAANFDLGTENFDIAELLTPIAETHPQTEPEPVRQQNQSSASETTTEPVRRMIMAPTDDPRLVPTEISTAVNPYRSTSPDRYKDMRVGPMDVDPGTPGGSTEIGSSSNSNSKRTESTEPDPPSVEPPAPVRKVTPTNRTVSIGVANGIAISLPKPPYPQTAIAVRAGGAVSVQVTIDETGKVISAKAASGHILLRQVAEQAAWKAKFTPTKLSNIPVKVTGVIVYNFTRN